MPQLNISTLVIGLVLAAVSDTTDFDYDTYKLKFLLAEELEDGD